MADADKAMNPQHFESNPADILVQSIVIKYLSKSKSNLLKFYLSKR